MANENIQVGFVGAGQMATALGSGFLQQNAVKTENLKAFDISSEARKRFESKTGAGTVDSLDDLIPGVDLLFLAVKPQILPEVAPNVATLLKTEQTVASIAAGITLEQLESMLAGHQKIIRIMPNTPSLVGAGASGLSRGPKVTDEEASLVQELMQTVGLCEQVPEKLLDAVTGLSGSGPAYVFQFIEALSDGGVLNGLPRPIATKLAAQTVMGAARMVLETGEHPGQLKDGVTSPGGTTICALAALEKQGFRSAAIQAVTASAERSRELGKK